MKRLSLAIFFAFVVIAAVSAQAPKGALATLIESGDRKPAIERIRTTLDGTGRRTASPNLIHLDRVEPWLVEAEARAAGLFPLPARTIAATDDHVGSSVVMLRG